VLIDYEENFTVRILEVYVAVSKMGFVCEIDEKVAYFQMVLHFIVGSSIRHWDRLHCSSPTLLLRFGV